MGGDAERAGWVEERSGLQKLISMIVVAPPGIVGASWAQVALAHYSNPFGLSFTGKGKYGLLLAHLLLCHAVFVWVGTCVGGCNKDTARKLRKSQLLQRKKVFYGLLGFSPNVQIFSL